MDEPDEKFIISWGLQTYTFFDSNADNCPSSNQCLTTFTITDDDPTVVSIARVGSGAVTEGQKIEFTVTLGRVLVAEEVIDVPLSIGGTNVTAGDWSLALKPGATNTGVARRIGNVFRFAGAGAQTATLELTAANDNTADHNETFNIALGTNTEFDAASLGTNVGGGADPHSANNAFSVTVNDPPPSVSVHPSDPIGVEGGGNSASVELRLARALTSGETLTVTYSLKLNAGASNSDAGVTLNHTPGANTSTGTLTVAGPNAPQNITLQLSPANNTVWNAGMRAREFELTGVSGVAGAGISGAGHTKIFVNDSMAVADRSTYLLAWFREAGEGSTLTVLLHGKAGRPGRRNARKELEAGERPYEWYNATVGVQNLTTGFDDLGEAYAGHDAFVGRLRREGDTDYYNVGVIGMGPSAQMIVPIRSDGAREGDERFRVFIADTDRTYMGVGGAYNDLDGAPAIEFTIKGQTGGPRRAPSEAPPPPQAPTQAVSNVQVTAVDANNAKVTWDAVEHATGYEVAWDALDGDGQSIAGGLSVGVTGASETIAHQAPGAASLEVTVAPQYVDGNGDTQTLAGLAGTATLDLGSTGGDAIGNGGSTDSVQDDGGAGATPPPDYSELKAKIQGYAGEQASNSDHARRWNRVLAALGDADAIAAGHDPMTASEARGYADRGWSRWDEVVDALTDLESRAAGEDQAEPEPAACVSDELEADVTAWSEETGKGDDHVERWLRVLHTFKGTANDSTIVLSSEAQQYVDKGWTRWVEVRDAIKCLEEQALRRAMSQ